VICGEAVTEKYSSWASSVEVLLWRYTCISVTGNCHKLWPSFWWNIWAWQQN